MAADPSERGPGPAAGSLTIPLPSAQTTVGLVGLATGLWFIGRLIVSIGAGAEQGVAG